MGKLQITDHDRGSAGLTYVYPVLSRRSGGLSIGINLNPNNACNWRCVYCQVPNLSRGSAPEIDVRRLENELRGMLASARSGEFYDLYGLDAEQRVIRDIAISGNGEPTSSRELPEVIAVIGNLCAEFDLLGRIKLVLITNGGLVHKPAVQTGLARWSALGGEVWFKFDSGTAEGIRRINRIHLTPETALRRLGLCAARCCTWVQTCVFALDGIPPSEREQQAYLDCLRQLQPRGIVIQGVLLYGLARPSMQPEAPRLSALPADWLNDLAGRIELLDIRARVNP